MSTVRTALVIGGGIAGPVTAIALRKAGIEARVYEAYPGPAFGRGNTLALEPNGVAALDIIDAGAAVRAVSVPIRHSYMTIGARSIAMPAAPDLEPRQLLQRADLYRVLHDRAVAAGVSFEYRRKLVGVDEHGAGITAHFADGASASADILIGADGIRSTVRKLIDPRAPEAEYTGMLGFGALLDAPELDLPPDTMYFAFGGNAYYLYGSVGDGKVLWGVNLPSAQYLSLNESKEAGSAHWLRVIRETYGADHPGGILARATTEADLEMVGALHIMPSVPHWYRGRMVLVGDAVHCPSNSTGQGASQAIESSIQLARCLRDLDDPAAAFAAYEGLRRKRVQRITARGAKINHRKTPGPVGKKLMPVLMPLFTRLMNFEKVIDFEQRYRIDWSAPVQRELARA
ncbi:FAD-dependent monooxygenase [Nocardia panacis]|uniref:FAD-dependent monooxygenase n=1 Tax=Nocardia panacis TaxID=2340916 RepID=A0A3A4KIE0_9NOCA|nr:FAD-dependent monooxygenase [Nocardia panacis]RJO79389.1 FAD-dependent monooxygenase [Nocardia panacis]